MPTRHWLQLSLTEGLGPILTARVVDALGSAEAACEATGAQLREVEGIGSGKACLISESLAVAAERVDEELAKAADAGARVVSKDDADYPPMVASMDDAPAVLYVRGTLTPRDVQAVAIVGSRKCSVYGREQADRFGALLAGAGITVISGGARGIDSAAHHGAMTHTNGRTFAVLGSGLDQIYPPENRGLFDQIAQRGAIISEYSMGTPPMAENFPRRNRIVAALSRGVIVVEADIRSGALITARLANEDYGRTVFAVPGRVDNPLSAGTHQLLRDGAILCANLEDVLDNLGPLPDGVAFDETETSDESPQPIETPAPRRVELTDRQSKIAAAFDGEPADVEMLIERTSLPASTVMSELTLMTLRGAVKRVDGQRYRLS